MEMRSKQAQLLMSLTILFLIRKSIQAVENPNTANTILTEINSGVAPTTYPNSFITGIFPYNKNIRPSGILGSNTNIDENGALYLDLQISFNQITAFDEKNQVLTTNMYLYLNWNDPRLSWDPSQTKYGNIYSITTTASNFWMPDLAIMNAVGSSQFIQLPSYQNVLITSNGTTYLTLALSGLQTRCKLDVYKYPFDTQNCSIVIGSWMSDTGSVNFITQGVFFDTSNYVQHPIWLLKSFSQASIFSSGRFTQYDQSFGDGGRTTTEDKAFYLILKRQPMYIMINGIFPCLVLNLVILVAFFIPFAQQVPLCMTSFLTFAVTGVRISSDIPIQSEYLPLVTLYIFLSIIYTLIGLTWFTLVNRYLTKKNLPPVLFKIAKVEKKFVNLLFEKIKPKAKKNSVKDASKIVVPEVVVQLENESPVDNLANKSDSKGQTDEIPRLNSLTPSMAVFQEEEKKKLKCNFCNRCENCTDAIDKEKIKKKEQTETESCITALNYSACLILLFIIFICNLTIWVYMAAS